MDLSGILALFGHSVYDPQIDALLQQCNALCEDKTQLKLYDSIKSKSLGVEFWFWWKGYYREQIGEPIGTVESDENKEVVLKEVRLMPAGLENAILPLRTELSSNAGKRHGGAWPKAVQQVKEFRKRTVLDPTMKTGSSFWQSSTLTARRCDASRSSHWDEKSGKRSTSLQVWRNRIRTFFPNVYLTSKP